jgi:hypothetical protein
MAVGKGERAAIEKGAGACAELILGGGCVYPLPGRPTGMHCTAIAGVASVFLPTRPMRLQGL